MLIHDIPFMLGHIERYSTNILKPQTFLAFLRNVLVRLKMMGQKSKHFFSSISQFKLSHFQRYPLTTKTLMLASHLQIFPCLDTLHFDLQINPKYGCPADFPMNQCIHSLESHFLSPHNYEIIISYTCLWSYTPFSATQNSVGRVA